MLWRHWLLVPKIRMRMYRSAQTLTNCSWDMSRAWLDGEMGNCLSKEDWTAFSLTFLADLQC